MRTISPASLTGAAAIALICGGCATTTPAPMNASLPDESPDAYAETTTMPQPLTLPAAESSAPSQTETMTYVVRTGDSLSLIAARFGITTRDIIDLNGIANPNKIRTGQELALPADVQEQPLVPNVSSYSRTISDNSYTIKPGDSLSRIAASHKTTVQAIKQANGLQSDTIRAGAQLTIPGNTATTSPRPPSVVLEPTPDFEVEPVEPEQPAPPKF